MATTPQFAVRTKAASPIAMWHLLSLDAPTVAALWVWFIARSGRLSLPLAAPAAMAIAVWMLYVVDRLLDARGVEIGRSGPDELEARHLFHRRHRRAFVIGLGVAAMSLAALLPRVAPRPMRLYLIETGVLVVWFVILHATRSAHRLPKEVAVGLFFSAAVFIPTVARAPGLRASLLPPAILFGALCSLNCLFIYAWEHENFVRPTRRLAHASTRVAVAHLAALAIAAIVAGFALAMFGSTSAKPIATACVLAAGGLLALDRNRRRLSRIDLRAASDLALLTPLLLLPLLR